MDTEAAPKLSLFNICAGAADEFFQREIALVNQNILDPNTDPEQKRTVTMEFTFVPFRDRSGAQVELKCKTKLAGVEPVEGNVFLTKRSGVVVAVPYDPKQEELFDRIREEKHIGEEKHDR